MDEKLIKKLEIVLLSNKESRLRIQFSKIVQEEYKNPNCNKVFLSLLNYLIAQSEDGLKSIPGIQGETFYDRLISFLNMNVTREDIESFEILLSKLIETCYAINAENNNLVKKKSSKGKYKNKINNSMRKSTLKKNKDKIISTERYIDENHKENFIFKLNKYYKENFYPGYGSLKLSNYIPLIVVTKDKKKKNSLFDVNTYYGKNYSSKKWYGYSDKSINLIDLLNDLDIERRIIIEGVKGSGKTTLLKKFSYELAEEFEKKDTRIFIYISLSEILTDSLEYIHINKFGIKHICIYLYKLLNLNLKENKFHEIFEYYYNDNKLFFLFDNYDKLSDDSKLYVDAFISKTKLFILTTSESKYNKLKNKKIFEFEILGFPHDFWGKTCIKEFLLEKDEKANNFIKEYKIIKSLICLPSNFIKFCDYFKSLAPKEEPCLTQIYTYLVDRLQIEECLQDLSAIAYENFKYKKFTNDKWKEIKFIIKDLINKGLIYKIDKKHYCFIERTFQEYLVSFYITSLNSDMLYKHIDEHKYTEEWKLIWRYTISLLNNNGKNDLDKFYTSWDACDCNDIDKNNNLFLYCFKEIVALNVIGNIPKNISEKWNDICLNKQFIDLNKNSDYDSYTTTNHSIDTGEIMIFTNNKDGNNQNQVTITANQTSEISELNAIEAFKNACSDLTLSYQNTVQSIENNPEIFGLSQDGLFVKAITIYRDMGSEEQVKNELDNLRKTDKTLFRKFLREKDSEKGLLITHYFSSKGCYSTYSYLRENGFDCDSVTKEGFSHNQLAIINKQYSFLRRNLDFKESKLTYTSVTIFEKFTLVINELHLAIMANDLQAVETIFETVKSIGHEAPHFGNILNLAIVFADFSMVQFLLQQKYRNGITLKELLRQIGNKPDMQALSLAAFLGKEEIVEYLLNYITSDISIANGQELIKNAFYNAALAGQVDIVKLFLDQAGYDLSKDTKYAFKLMVELNQRYPDIFNIISSWKKSEFQEIDPKTQIYKNLVFQGGGVRGVIYPYVLKRLQKACEARQEYCRQKGHNPHIAASLDLEGIKRVAGTSAGSIVALGVALNTPLDILEEKMSYDFSNFLDTDELQKMADFMILNNKKHFSFLEGLKELLKMEEGEIQEFYEHCEGIKKIHDQVGGISIKNLIKTKKNRELIPILIKHGIAIKNLFPQVFQKFQSFNQEFTGCSSGQAIRDWLYQFMQEQGIENPDEYTFGDLAQAIQNNQVNGTHYKHLYVVITCLDTQAPITLSSEDTGCHNYIILDAVRASMSIPFAFKPWRPRYKTVTGEITTTDAQYVDGGLLRNYAITEFDRKKFTHTDQTGDSNYPMLNQATLGFCFKNSETAPYNNDELTLKDFLLCLANIYMHAESIIAHYEDKAYGRSIVLDTGNITTFSFKELTNEEKTFLNRSAQKAVKHYFFGEKSNIVQLLQSFGNPVFGQKEESSWDSDDEKEIKIIIENDYGKKK